ncbi:MAG: putative porin [Gammaproteobacteria bacterium]|nr:putative porin [Gammaproteobacteria bacterium]
MNGKRLALAAGLLLASPLTPAAVTDAEFQALKDSIAALTQKLGQMEQALAAEKARTGQAEAVATTAAPAVAPARPAAASWAEKVTLQGDLRGRYENIDDDSRSDERNRERIRARAGIVARPEPGLEVGFGLSTSQDADPVSSNQTIGSGGSRKDIYLDLAYFNWAAAEGLNVIGGKFRNNLYKPGKHSLIWDGDLNPEGLGLSYVNGIFFANAMTTWVESDSDSTEAIGAGGQIGVAWPFADGLKLTAGAGYFTINTEGKGGFYAVPGKSAKFFGNSVDANNRYLYDYDELEGFAELGFALFGMPVSLFIDYVTNTDAGEFDTGWAAGAQLGVAKARGSWEFLYAYQDLERDAVFGLWTDSDFGGGGTDNSGHLLRGAYALTDKTSAALSYFINEVGGNAGVEHNYDRFQLDLNFKY